MADQLASHPPGHNGIQVLQGITPAEFFGWLTDMQALDDEVAAAVDKRKAKLAKIKERLGKDEFASFKSVRKDAEMPGESRERRELSRQRMMQWLNKPLGHQASMDLRSDDPDVVALNAHELHRVDGQGLAAGKAGHRRDTNPWNPGSEISAVWDAGWLRGQASIAATLAPDSPANGEQPRRPGRPRKASSNTQVH